MKNNRKISRRLLRIFVGLILLGLLWTGYVQVLIHFSEKAVDPDTRDVGIVLGAALWDNRPSPALRERLDLALRLYEQGRFTHFIVTGGLDHNGSTIPEGEGMAVYLMQRGIPESAITIEPEARSTYQNLKFSQSIMKQNNWHTAWIITHTYHGARSLDIAEYLGYQTPAVALTDSEVMWVPWHKARETLAFTKWILEKGLGIAQ